MDFLVIKVINRDENERLGNNEPDQYFFERTLRKAGESDASSYSPCKIVSVYLFICLFVCLSVCFVFSALVKSN